MKSKSLKFVFDDADITPDFAKGFGKALNSMTELYNLDLDMNNNKRLGDGAVHILKAIFNMEAQKLKKVDLYLNNCGI